MIRDINVDPEGLSQKRLNLITAECLGSPTVPVAAASAADIHTSAANASYTAAAGTQPSAPRNLYYEASASSTVAFASCSGTISVAGLDHHGNGVTETVAVSQLVAAGTNGMVGTYIFASINSNGITRGALTLSNSTHAQSNNVSWYLGGGAFLGLPSYNSASGAIKHARVGTSPVRLTASAEFGTYAYTNGSKFARVNLSRGTYATNKPVVVYRKLNG
jgi:hypothetical protein